MRDSDIFVVSAWMAAFFGFLEGLVLTVTRIYPAILAPYKASAHLLWISALVDLPLFALAGAILLAGLKLLRAADLLQPWVRAHEWRLLYTPFLFWGAFTVLEAPKLIGLPSAAILSLGMALSLARMLTGKEAHLTGLLRGRLIVVPVFLLIVALGVYGYERLHEVWLLRQVSAT